MILSSGVVVVRKEGEHYKYLLLRAYKNWDFPKGEVEESEDPLETAIREVKEETGIDDLNFKWGYIYKHTLPYLKGNKIARYYIAETTKEDILLQISPELGKPEHEEYKWLYYSEMRGKAPVRLWEIIDWSNRVIYE